MKNGKLFEMQIHRWIVYLHSVKYGNINKLSKIFIDVLRDDRNYFIRFLLGEIRYKFLILVGCFVCFEIVNYNFGL